MIRRGSDGCERFSGVAWISGSTPTRRGRRPSSSIGSSPLLPFGPSALEQPVPHAQVGALAELRPRLGVPVMLDESLCGYPDAQAAVDDRTADLLNVRLSKCGGIFPSLRIIGLARRSGLGIQLGCHPGETVAAVGRRPPSCQSSRGAPLRRRFLRPSHPRRQPDPRTT